MKASHFVPQSIATLGSVRARHAALPVADHRDEHAGVAAARGRRPCRVPDERQRPDEPAGAPVRHAAAQPYVGAGHEARRDASVQDGAPRAAVHGSSETSRERVLARADLSVHGHAGALLGERPPAANLGPQGA